MKYVYILSLLVSNWGIYNEELVDKMQSTKGCVQES